ncbi:MAG TPA: sensor histidine kinase [Puia sp.]|jgi:signal transduction histidine kinase|nr:sensor histidine kinase [Puia sp.]
MNNAIHLEQWADSRPQTRPFYMATLDVNERMTFVNTPFLQTFRCARIAVGKAEFTSLMHVADKERIRKAIADCRGQQVAASVAARVKNSPYQWIRWQISLFPGSGGNSGLLCLGEDVFGEALQAMPYDGDGVGIDVPQASAEAIIRAQQKERERIGHELHDNVNQILASAQLFLGQLDPGNREFRQVKKKTTEIINLAIEEIRHLSRDMVMPDFKEIGLTGSIRQLVKDLRYCRPFEIRFLHDNKKSIESLDEHRKITLFRIVQEQIKNIIKYARAKYVVIDLQGNETSVRLEIADDGKGFDPATTRHGLGLSNIYERTKLYQGEVTLEAAPGRGCTLVVRLPRVQCG